jgi:hypothetical protein
MKKMILYRPIGLHELRLIYESKLSTFPPRFPEQPIFYPVLNIEYARQIAFDWNTKSEPYAGYVTEFEVDDKYISQFERQIVGGQQHEELWIPAEKLDEFNRHIIDKIKIVDAKFGKEFQGFIPQQFGLKGENATSQFVILANISVFNSFFQENVLFAFLHHFGVLVKKITLGKFFCLETIIFCGRISWFLGYGFRKLRFFSSTNFLSFFWDSLKNCFLHFVILRFQFLGKKVLPKGKYWLSSLFHTSLLSSAKPNPALSRPAFGSGWAARFLVNFFKVKLSCVRKVGGQLTPTLGFFYKEQRQYRFWFFFF